MLSQRQLKLGKAEIYQNPKMLQHAAELQSVLQKQNGMCQWKMGTNFAGDGKVKKESVAALVRRQQGRQEKALADVYQRQLKLQTALTKQNQENVHCTAELQLLTQEHAALTAIYKPLKAREGMCELFHC